jgi:hypothetical protein
MMALRWLTVVLLTVAAFILNEEAVGKAAVTGLFPCRWNYNLYVGLRAGYETGGENADCAGTSGTLTLAARLYRSPPGTHTWRLTRSPARSWVNPTGNRYVEFSRACTTGRIRAVFTWALRDPRGHLVAHNTVVTAPINDTGRGCKYILR